MKKLIKFDYYYYRDEDDPKIIFTADWYKFEDRFKSPSVTTPHADKIRLNKDRHKRFGFYVNLCGFRLSIEVKLKHVGLVYYGRDLSKPNWYQKKKLNK